MTTITQRHGDQLMVLSARHRGKPITLTPAACREIETCRARFLKYIADNPELRTADFQGIPADEVQARIETAVASAVAAALAGATITPANDGGRFDPSALSRSKPSK